LPTPALKYQLLPDARATVSGDAAPLYKRVGELLAKKEFEKKRLPIFDWLAAPLEELPREDVRKFLTDYQEVYKLLDQAARCERCDWKILEQVRAKGTGVKVPDEADPTWWGGKMLALRARLEIAEGHLEDALWSLRAGLVLVRRTGEALCKHCFVMGVGLAVDMQRVLEDFVARPDAPNLYFALTDLPQPFLNLRQPLEGERLGVYATFPGLPDVILKSDAPPMTAQQIQESVAFIGAVSFPDDADEKAALTKLTKTILARHEAATKAVIASGRPRAKVVAMPHVQVALLHAMLEFDAALDEVLVAQNLPYPQCAERVRKVVETVENARKNDPNAPALPVAREMLYRIDLVTLFRVRTDRRFAALRTVEAIRLYAATHDGKFPARLADIEEVPAPLDPVTAKDFEYRCDGDVATLRGPAPGKDKPNSDNTLVYELRIRK